MHKKLALVTVGILALIICAVIAYVLLEPFSPPIHISTSNVTDQQVTISWVTAKPTKGSVELIQSGTLYKDDREKRLNMSYRYTAHSVTITGLRARTQYKYRIREGWRAAIEGTIATLDPIAHLTMPHPVYGMIAKGNKSKPAVGVLVYLHTKDSLMLSTVTNEKGRWSIDLGNMRSRDGKTPYTFTAKTTEELIIDSGSYGAGKATTVYGHDQPWPIVIMK